LDVDGGCLLRLGHHSGAESVTIEGHRSILIRGKKKYYSDKATTFWLAAEDRNKYDKSKILPFGWCLLGEVKVEQEKEWQKIEEAISSISYPQPQLETALEGEEHIKIERTIEEWTSAYVKWNPGNQEVIATYEGKKATARGKDIVREAMRKKLVDKRETVRTKVLVEKIYNRYTIVKIDEAE
ncbi:MAG: hypothetical protein N2513_10565, partial [Deltaproteobacteria bacterium]|nr:hypothetical protein [Deltaproteobacteria bacterium]